MMTTQGIPFDVMLDGRWQCTLALPITKEHVLRYDGDMIDVDYDVKDFKDFVERKRPSLKGKDYKIAFITKRTAELWER